VQPPQNIFINSLVFAQYISVTDTETDRHTDHATCDMCRNSPHLCYACDVAEKWIKNITH